MTPRIPFLDLRAPYLELQREIDEAMLRVANRGWFLLGEELTAFEGEFARYVGAEHCIGLANGLDALHLSLRSLGVGQGDEVIVPSNTYIATWLAVSMVGAIPVPVEPNPVSCNIEPEKIEVAVSSRTKVILPVHLYGLPADLSPILDLAGRHGIAVLEDAAQAHGAEYRGRRIGSHGTLTAWSFYPGKNLGAFGDGGAVTTNDAGLAASLRMLRNYGSRERYVNEVQGVNSRLDEIQAAVLRVKLGHLDEWNERRSVLAARYNEALAHLPLQLPRVPPSRTSSWHLYVVRTDRRDLLRAHLQGAGIETLIHYPTPPHRQQAYAGLSFAPDAFPVANALHDTVLSLPFGPHLSLAQQDRVIQAVVEFFSPKGAR